MKLSKQNGYEKTEYLMLASANGCQAVAYRRVWKKDDRYYVSYENEIRDVTEAKPRFIID